MQPDTLRAQVERAVSVHLRPSPETPPSPDEIAIVDSVMAVVTGHVTPADRPIGWRLREAREAAGLSQAVLAGRLRVKQHSISNGERGGAINPVLLVRWATAVGLDDLPGEDATVAYWRGWDDCAEAAVAAMKRGAS